MNGTYEKNVQFAKKHVEKTRGLQRTTDFVRPGSSSIELRGWSVKKITELVCSGSQKPFEIIIPDGAVKIEREIGDIVSTENVFASSDGAVFQEDQIYFYTEDGQQVNSKELEYILQNGRLGSNQLFGRVELKDNDVRTAWKNSSRRSTEARKDKSINILYMTFGAIKCEIEDGSNRGTRIKTIAPLFMCPIREDLNSKSIPKFTIIQPKLTINSILARQIKNQFFTEIFDGIPTEFGFSELMSMLERIRENLSETNEIQLLENHMRICLLDSSNEMMCQAVERRLEQIAQCPLISVFSGEEEYQPKTPNPNRRAIYPLAADDSQRDVVERAVAGDSVNVTACPGSGKSQTVVNVAANLVLNKQHVCIMSEKIAALEVVLENLAKCGLDQYCLFVKDRLTVKDYVSKLKRLLASIDEYVETEDAKAAIANYQEVCAEFEKFNQLFEVIPTLGTNLYSLIGEAITSEDLECDAYINVHPTDYSPVRRKLQELQCELIDTISSKEWENYLETGSTDDEEQDEMLDEAIVAIESYGLNLKGIVTDKKVRKEKIADIVISQLARYFANKYIEIFDLKAYGNKKLKMLYKKLLVASNAWQAVSVAFIKQELNRIVKNAAKDSKLVELLERLATSKISTQDFFNTYGEEIMKLCPILVGTPTALVQHEKLNTFDSLIIDESSQMPFTSVLPFLTGDRQIIVFGDPMQLDITNFWAKAGIYEQQEGEEFDLSETDKSILHVCQAKLPSCQLQYHYRSKTEHLITVSNLRCYDGLLNIAPDYYFGQENLPDELGCELVELTDVEISPKGANLTEAREIVDRVTEIRQRYPDKTIGIITFNDNQQTAINDEIDKRIDQDPDLYDTLNLNGDKLFLRTLENSQGKEADVIFVSIGHYRRNKDGSINKQISILNNDGALNRLNVLFTRAKEKIVVTISFSYKELKNSEKGIYRLYEYLRYFATGECDGLKNDPRGGADKYNKVLVDKVLTAVADYKVLGKVGHANMTVDVGLVKDGEPHYDVGLIFPSKALTPNTLCTKVSVLERAGWSLLPLSPITCFTKPKIFEEQMTHDLEEKVCYSVPTDRTYLTNVKPAALFSMQDFVQEVFPLESAITKSELLKINYFYAHENVFAEEVRLADERKVTRMAKKGQLQAKLKLYLLWLKKFAEADRLDDLLIAVEELYRKEETAAYLYAQLLRVRANAKDASLINKLLAEARSLGIKVA